MGRSLSRRAFLKVATASSLAPTSLALFNNANAQPHWGTLPSLANGDEKRLNYKILEIHLMGGLSPWESFYYQPNKQLKTAAVSSESKQLSGEVHLSPHTKPLWRQDIIERMRVVVMQHEQRVHEMAIPLSLSGYNHGNPKLAGLGAAIGHRYKSRLQPQPHSYVLLPEKLKTNSVFQAAYTTGQHGTRYQPEVMGIDGDGLQQAAKLLNKSDMLGGARHVCLIESGVEQKSYGYDNHGEIAPQLSANLWDLSKRIEKIIRKPDSLSSDNTIDLGDTLIVIKTEFGRTPENGVNLSGRDHWTKGYTATLIGGPVTQGVAGHIDSAGYAKEGYSPTELQAALMTAAGVDPFSTENFAVNDINPALVKAGSDRSPIDQAQAATIGMARKILGMAV